MYWSNLLHIYQPPNQKKEILARVVEESYARILDILEKRPKIKINLNICASLTEQLAKSGFQKVIKRIKNLAERGQIELVGSAKYHPILPLLPKSEVIRQIKLNENSNQKYFGRVWQKKGFFLPELAYDKKTARIIEQLGYQWIILDEIAYGQRPSATNYKSNTNIRITNSKLKFDRLYQIQGLKLKVFFRNRVISNLFFTGLAKNFSNFMKFIKDDPRLETGYLITCLDGENLGHHCPGAEKLWAEILDSGQIQTLFFSELDFKLKNNIEEIDPLPSSWASSKKELNQGIPYALWFHPKNKIHQLQWQLTNLAIKTINRAKNDLNYRMARQNLDQALFSCQYWWASGQPWWDRKMIERGASNFIESLKILKKIEPKILKQAENLQQKINQLAREWEETDRVDQIRRDYLSTQNQTQWFGGKQIS